MICIWAIALGLHLDIAIHYNTENSITTAVNGTSDISESRVIFTECACYALQLNIYTSYVLRTRLAIHIYIDNTI